VQFRAKFRFETCTFGIVWPDRAPVARHPGGDCGGPAPRIPRWPTRTETFARRVDEALHSSDHDELRGLTSDLPVASDLLRAQMVIGRRVVEAEVRPGDTVHLGGCQIRL
jgi:hypothetical protein